MTNELEKVLSIFLRCLSGPITSVFEMFHAFRPPLLNTLPIFQKGIQVQCVSELPKASLEIINS